MNLKGKIGDIWYDWNFSGKSFFYKHWSEHIIWKWILNKFGILFNNYLWGRKNKWHSFWKCLLCSSTDAAHSLIQLWTMFVVYWNNILLKIPLLFCNIILQCNIASSSLLLTIKVILVLIKNYTTEILSSLSF